MAFNTPVFVVFFVVVLMLYALMPKRYKWIWLLAASWFFYLYASAKFFIFVLLSGASAWAGTLYIQRLHDRARQLRACDRSGEELKHMRERLKRRQKRMLISVLVLNFGILAVLKYFGFFCENLNQLLESFSLEARIPGFHLILPLGISFYTFQTMSYTIDVYRGEVAAQKNILTFATYVTLFPQLIAGPIVQYKTVEKELMHRKVTLEDFSEGAFRFSVGLAKKVLLANQIGSLWDSISQLNHMSVATAWLGAIAYSFQIYFDFSGYSDMAIGLGKMFGFDFMENFNYPYISTSIREFWRRWHISLSTWFREYLYIPLGGNRKGQVRTYVNLLIVFFATGLWHGAGATFIIWGLYHGLFLVVERMGLGKLLEKNCFRGLNHIYTTLVVVVGWVFFRADTLADAKVILHQMFTWENGIYPASLFVNRKVIFLAVLGVLLSGIVQSICPKLREHLYEKEVTKTVDIVIMAVLLFLCTMYLVSSTYNPFIYFRF